VALAQTGARTLVLELDMRRPRLADVFELPGKHGISRYLSGQSDLNTEIHQTAVPNLFVIPAGPVPPNPPELIGSARMTTAFEWLGRNFEYVLVDAPPLMAVSDALIVSRQVGGVILVVHGGKTPKEAVQKARNLLMSVNAKILGTLVNNVKMDRSQLYYSAIYSQARDTYLAAPGPPSLQLK
jgi:capsular exopolysaccharide synthesis family protein